MAANAIPVMYPQQVSRPEDQDSNGYTMVHDPIMSLIKLTGAGLSR